VGVVGGIASPAGAAEKIPSSFAHRVEATCAANVHRYPQVGHFPFDNFDPQHPLATQLPAVGAYFTMGQRSIRPLESALTSLGEPTRGRAAWHRVRSLAFAILENEKAQRNAALAADVPGFVATVDKGDRLVRRLKTAAIRGGLSVTGPCSIIFQ
jgi:hypothetical protein